MLLATALSFSHRPTSRFSPILLDPRLESLKPFSLHRFPASEPVSSSGFLLRKNFVYEKKSVFGMKPMAELVGISAFRSQDDEESLEFLDNEVTLSNGSPGFSSTSDVMPAGGGGLEWTLNRLSKWIVTAIFVIVILWRHDGETLWAAIGAVLNGVLSVILKRTLNQKRPISTLRSDPGMPSSHAQSIFFAVIYAILSLVKSFGLNEVTVIAGVLALAFSSYLSWLRVSQQLHTISQVVVGAIVGSICSFFWFQAWHGFVLKAFISFMWVRVMVILAGIAFCVYFAIYAIQKWILDEQSSSM